MKDDERMRKDEIEGKRNCGGDSKRREERGTEEKGIREKGRDRGRDGGKKLCLPASTGVAVPSSSTVTFPLMYILEKRDKSADINRKTYI